MQVTKPLLVAAATLSLLGGSAVMATTAQAAPKNCPSENFQIVDGRCVSDGRAEKLNDGKGDDD